MDVSNENGNQKFETAFFNVPASASEQVKKLVLSLKIENEKTGFVNKLPQNWGLPKWESVIWQKNETVAMRDSTI